MALNDTLSMMDDHMTYWFVNCDVFLIFALQHGYIVIKNSNI